MVWPSKVAGAFLIIGLVTQLPAVDTIHKRMLFCQWWVVQEGEDLGEPVVKKVPSLDSCDRF